MLSDDGFPAGATSAATVLLVDDDQPMRDAVARALRLEGYAVTLATDGREALGLAATGHPDLIVLDVSMPMMNGVEACRRLRSAGDQTPVLMLTARDRIKERVAGLDAGADDYLTKPFALEELLARVRALTRRRQVPDRHDSRFTSLRYADITLYPGAHRATRAGRPLQLTATEFSLLEAFLLNHDRVLSREYLYETVWGADLSARSKVLEVYLGYLRAKLEAEGETRVIHTIRGVGYVLRETP